MEKIVPIKPHRTKKQLEADLADARKQNEENHRRYLSAAHSADQAEKQEKEAREQFDDLKRRVHELTIANARLEGYLDRVSEDDAVRDGHIEIPTSDNSRIVPKRPPRPRWFADEGNGAAIGQAGVNERFRRPRHWLDY